MNILQIPNLVTVVVHTYNQEDYIAECLDGIISQDIFPQLNILVIDDCSFDQTREITLLYKKRFPNQIKIVSNSFNHFSKGCIIGLDSYLEIKSKYIAWCDGDDYWINPKKLRMQIEIMESNQNLSIVHTNYLKLLEDNSNQNVVHRQAHESIRASQVDSGKRLIQGNMIKHSTAVVLLEEIDFNFLGGATGIYAGDWLIYISAARTKKIHYLEEETTAVRITHRGIWNGQSEVRNNFQKDLIREYSALALPKSPLRQSFRRYLLLQYLRRLISDSEIYRPFRPIVSQFRKIF